MTSRLPLQLHPGENSRAVLCLLALAMVFDEYWLLNYCAFPLFDTTSIWVRELSAAVGGCALAVLALVSFWSVHQPGTRLFTVGIPGAMVIGTACVMGGLAGSSISLVALGASLATVGGGLANIRAGLACVGLKPHTLACVVTGAYVVSYASRWLFVVLPNEACFALFVLFPVASVLCVARCPSVLGRVSQPKGIEVPESPAHMWVTSPSAFLPFGHLVFLTLVVFRFVYGCTLTFGEVGRIPALAAGTLAPLCALLVIVVVRHKDLPADVLLKLSILSSAAGFLFASIAGGPLDELAQVLLATGTGFFEIVMCYVLISIGSHSAPAALPALSWGNALASWGTIFGAAFGRFANGADAGTLGIATAILVLALMAYVLFALPRLNLSHTIDRVAAPGPIGIDDPALDDARAFTDERCATLAKTNGLTEREAEVLALLARGRNARFIQDALSISYSTTKTHVGRVYRKLGVHTHQELIDVVEQVGNEGVRS